MRVIVSIKKESIDDALGENGHRKKERDWGKDMIAKMISLFLSIEKER